MELELLSKTNMTYNIGVKIYENLSFHTVFLRICAKLGKGRFSLLMAYLTLFIYHFYVNTRPTRKHRFQAFSCSRSGTKVRLENPPSPSSPNPLMRK